jgi:Ca2+-binding RTX toxin-like protein
VKVATDGSWSLTPATALTDGTHHITATATNAAGNTSPSTGDYPLTVDTIPKVATVEPGQPGLSDDSVTEGGSVSYNVTLSIASDKSTTLSFKLGDGTAGATDFGTPTFTNNVTLNQDGKTINVPPGVTSFTVTVPTTQDTLPESTETLPLAIGGVTGTALIIDNDAISKVDLDGDDSSGVAAGGFKTTFTEKGAAVHIADTDIGITDADSTRLASATVTLTNAKAGDVLSFLDTVPANITAKIVGNQVVFTGSDTLANYQSAIRAVGFANTSNNPDTTARNFDVVVNDGGNTSDVAHATVNVTAVNDTPVVQVATNNVAEEGLPGGLAGTTGTANVPGANACAGKIIFSDVDSSSLTVSLSAPTTDVYAANGTKVTWASDGHGGLVGTAGTTTVATATVDNANNPGAYTFTLLAPIKHTGAGEDTQTISIGVDVTDGLLTSHSSLNIDVKDDSPVAPPPIQQSLQTIDSNLLIVLDNSGSMSDPSGIGGLTRLAAAVQSINNLLDKYEDLGGVAVRLVTFSSNATTLGNGWLTVAEAKTLLAAVQPTLNTDYDAALATAQTAYATSGKLLGAQNIAYFFSDGNPNEGTGGQSGAGTTAAEEQTWTTFLNNNQINCYAVGLGTGVNQDALDPIAYDGQASDNTHGVVVTSLTALDATLADTYAGSIKGNLTASGTFKAAMGADGFGKVDNITVDGVVYRFDATHTHYTVQTKLLGTLDVDQSGDYSYNAPGQLGTAAKEVFSFGLADGDGDVATSTLTLNLERTQVLNGTTGGDTYVTAQQSSILMGRDGNDALTAGPGGSHLYGNAGNDTLTGGKGADLLHGGAGADVLNGGEGVDTLIGGTGSDTMTGGAGADVFAWHLADPGTTSARAQDTIKDFSTSQGDVLDLRDLLQGETNVPATLDNYLSFDTTTTSGTTIIKVSPTGGGFGGGLFNPSTETERIVLEGVNLRTDLGLASNANDATVIAKLLEKKSLLVDNA